MDTFSSSFMVREDRVHDNQNGHMCPRAGTACETGLNRLISLNILVSHLFQSSRITGKFADIFLYFGENIYIFGLDLTPITGKTCLPFCTQKGQNLYSFGLSECK